MAAAYGSLSRTLQPEAGERRQDCGQNKRSGREGWVKTGETFSRNYLSLFPTVFASYKVDSLNTLTFSYGRRLDRPNYYLLNPSRDYIDKYSYRVGNPRLLPQFINNVELGYSWKGELDGARLALCRQMASSAISSCRMIQTKTAYEMHDNIAGYRQGGLSVNYNKALRPWWTTNIYGDVYLREYTGHYYGIDYRQQGSSYSFNVAPIS